MSINLQKGQRITLEKRTGELFTRFCVGVDWGAIEYETKEGGVLGIGKKTVVRTREVDIDLSCVMYDGEGKLVDYVYSPLYRPELMAQFDLDTGKFRSRDGAIEHSGDDREGDLSGQDSLDNEVLCVDLEKLASDVQRIFFFVNIIGDDELWQVPYISIKIYEGTPQQVENVYAQYDTKSEPSFMGKKALLLGELYAKAGKWRFNPIGDAFEDVFMGQTIQRISQKYARSQ